jgi:YggT family protein
MLATIVGLFDLFIAALRPAVFLAGVLTAIAAVVSYSVRTRRITPFSPVARFMRERVDPWLIAPMERRVLRAGGTPYSAPWWTLAAVVLGGLVLISVVGFIRDQFVMMAYFGASGPRGILRLAVQWTFGILRIALFARVIASWVGGSPYSKWWRWAFVITEPILAPLRRVIPTIGMIDITIIVAYFGLGFLQGFIMRAI